MMEYSKEPGISYFDKHILFCDKNSGFRLNYDT
jgi:hypothetical protein